jgi:arsenate reductase
MTANILFLCPHHAAKSVIAAAYFNRLAPQSGLTISADSAGTEPDPAVSPVVIAMLSREGMDVLQHKPRRVTVEELIAAQRIISMGCPAEHLEIAPERVEQWNDLPNVSQNPEGARGAIRAHVEPLISELQSNSR